VNTAGTCSQYWNTKMNGDQFEWHIYRPEEAKGKGKTKFRVRCWDIDLDREEKYQLGRDIVFQSIIRKVITDKDEKKKKENNSESNRSAKRSKPNPPPMREPLEAIHLVQDFSTLKKLTKNEILEARNSYTVKSTPNLQNKRKRAKCSNSDDVPFTESPLLNMPVPISVAGQEDEEKVAMRKRIEELQAELNRKNSLIETYERIMGTQSGHIVGFENVYFALQADSDDTEFTCAHQKEEFFVKVCNGESLQTPELSNLDFPVATADLSKAVPVFPNKVNEPVLDPHMQVLESGVLSGPYTDYYLANDYDATGQLFNIESSEISINAYNVYSDY